MLGFYSGYNKWGKNRGNERLQKGVLAAGRPDSALFQPECRFYFRIFFGELFYDGLVTDDGSPY